MRVLHIYVHMHVHTYVHIYVYTYISIQTEQESETKKHVSSVHQTCEHALFTSFPEASLAIYYLFRRLFRLPCSLFPNALSQAAPAA